MLDSGPLDLEGAWHLCPRVSLREEPFGALAYHHDTRRLVFLKSPDLVHLVRRLAEFPSARAALEGVIDPPRRERYAAALAHLVATGVLDGD